MNLNPGVIDPLKDVYKVLIEGAKEIVGPEEARRLFLDERPKTTPSPSLSAFQRRLNERYGARGGQGLAQRIGQSAFQHALRRWGETTGMSSTAFRLLPAGRRVSTGLVLLATIFGEANSTEVSVSEDGEHWFWQVERCPACDVQPGKGPICYLVVGLLQAFMSWVAGNRSYAVRETSCIGAGAPVCLFQIDKQAID